MRYELAAEEIRCETDGNAVLEMSSQLDLRTLRGMTQELRGPEFSAELRVS